MLMTELGIDTDVSLRQLLNALSIINLQLSLISHDDMSVVSALTSNKYGFYVFPK